MYLSIPDDERLFTDASQTDRMVLTGISVVLNQNRAISGRILIVRATEIEVDGIIKLPSGHVDLFARRIIAHPGAIIDVSGETGDPDFYNRAPAPNGVNPGDSGSHGSNGGDGSDGGRITITCESLEGAIQLLANGGKGGDAQSGGAGQTGTTGPPMRECDPPGPGGTGGSPGQAGLPGRGGDGGHISVSIVEPPADPEQIKVSVAAGQAGKPGNHGEVGEGGMGGEGGRHMDIVRDPCIV